MRSFSELADLCEILKGPSLDCNEAIYEALGALRPVYPNQYWTSPNGTNKHYDALVPRYTHDTHAALLLLPEGWQWQISNRAPSPQGGRAYINNKELQGAGPSHLTANPKYRGEETTAATPTLALCTVCLRVMAALSLQERT